ncbi:INO80 complex subunit D [Chamberlinius hualienensis]
MQVILELLMVIERNIYRKGFKNIRYGCIVKRCLNLIFSMYEGKHIHFSPSDNRPLCSYSGKLCRQRRVNGYAFCIRHILEDKSSPFKQCAHVAKYNNQKCTNPIPSKEDREFCNSHMQVAGMVPKKERKNKKEKDALDGKFGFVDRVKGLIKEELSPDSLNCADDPYAFSEVGIDFSDSKSTAEINHRSPMRDDFVSDRLQSHAEIEQPPKTNNIVTNNAEKSKGHSQSKSCKTVNRLESKLARNKIIDKRKKNCSIDSPAFPLCGDNAGADHLQGKEKKISVVNSPKCATVDSVNVDLTTSSSAAKLCGSSATALKRSSVDSQQRPSASPERDVRTKECDSLLKTKSGTTYSVLPNTLTRKLLWRKPRDVANPVHKLNRIIDNDLNFKNNIFPLGLEASDSESGDSDGELHQRHWLSSPTDPEQWVDVKHCVLLRPVKLNLSKSELRRQCTQMRESQMVSKASQKQLCSFAQAILNASRVQPLRTAKLLDAYASNNVQPKTKVVNGTLTKQKCCYTNDETECLRTALPYTRHCVRHIMYNIDQLLFEHCTAKFADNTQCCIPVFDICHELPLCVEHARKRDNYTKMSTEPKPKKPRKKTKPSALTRPPKRGKKKKRQVSMRVNDISTVSQSSTSQDLPSSMHFDMSTDAISPGTHNLDSSVNSDLDGPLESDLGTDLDGQLSPGTIDKTLELPMDAVELANHASRLLEEHDFSEVLNKIPDDAFQELFNDSGKNGSLSPNKEEAEELERALAAVDKDVKSFAKFHPEHLSLHDSLLQSDNLSATIDSTLSDLGGTGLGIDSLHVITSSLSSSDLNSLSQVLSSMTSEGTLPILSEISDSAVHSDITSGFSIGSHPLLCGRIDSSISDQFACDPLETSSSQTSYWLNEQSSALHNGPNGLLSPNGDGYTLPSKYNQHSHITSVSNKIVDNTKGRHNFNNINHTNVLDNSIGISNVGSLVMELADNSTESVS